MIREAFLTDHSAKKLLLVIISQIE